MGMMRRITLTVLSVAHIWIATIILLASRHINPPQTVRVLPHSQTSLPVVTQWNQTVLSFRDHRVSRAASHSIGVTHDVHGVMVDPPVTHTALN